jgi:hypothetical protein
MVDDPDAAGGRALRYTGDPEKDHQRPVNFGVYNNPRKVFGPSITLKPTDVPQDEKYHWYKVGRFPVVPGVILWAHWTWWLSVDIGRTSRADDPDPQRDVWVSLKVTGPAYVKDSKQPNALTIDRVILTKAD